MNSLLQFVRDHHVARESGVDVAAVRDQRAARQEVPRSGVTRRQFLAGSATALGALALPRVASSAGQPRIAIVGAGIAGLSTALTLKDAGIYATVYEASGRVGGRMFSNNGGYWDDNQVSEWCGELVDSGHKTVQGLAKRFGLPLDDLFGAMPNGSEDTYHFFGQYYRKADADTDFQPVHQALNTDVQAANYPTLYNVGTPAGRALDAMSVHDWIESRVPGGHGSPFGMLLDVAYNIEYGAETTDQSALNLVYLLGYKSRPGNFNMFGASDERYHIRGGNQKLPQAIAGELGDSVVNGMRLLAIARNGNGTYDLTFGTGNGNRTVNADVVALTLPFAVLRSLDYRKAGFDGLKDTAIRELGRGHNGKLQLQFNSRYWNTRGAWPGVSNGATYADTGYQATWDVSRAQPGARGILVDYTGGATTDAMNTRTSFTPINNAGTQKDATRFLSQINPVYPGIGAAWNGKATSSLPHLDPNMMASYSYWRVGQYTAFSGYEKAQQGAVFFAGEHTSQDFQGFMEGGASEGVRCAVDILKLLGMK